MQIQEVLLRAVFAIFVPVLAAASQPSAEPILRVNGVPNVGHLEAEQPLGDLWTFTCPSGGTVNVFVDTKDDADNFESDIDPVLLVADGAGNLLASIE